MWQQAINRQESLADASYLGLNGKNAPKRLVPRGIHLGCQRGHLYIREGNFFYAVGQSKCTRLKDSDFDEH